MKTLHQPVLLQETLEGLSLKENDIVFDGTLGGAGHAKKICEVLGKSGTYIGVDRDHGAVEEAKVVLKGALPTVYLRTENYRNVDHVLEEFGFHSVDKVLLDLGISSDQLERSGRGFSFQRDEPLLMTMEENPDSETLTAKYVVNHFSESALTDVLRNYGDEQYAKKIAKGIVTLREEREIETSAELAEIVEKSVPSSYRHKKVHPATKTFQAIRIAVNDEYGGLSEALEKCWNSLSKGEGRIAVIAFHSLEDRLVKNFLREKKKAGEAEVLFKKPVIAGDEEVKKNPRSRSAKLRVARRL